MNHEQLAHDYRSSMQRAALVYLQRHETQFLMTDSYMLYDNCVRHLTIALEAPLFMAEQLVHNAWTELQAIKQYKRFGVDRATLHLSAPPERHTPPTQHHQNLLTILRDSEHKYQLQSPPLPPRPAPYSFGLGELCS
ncbi:hypothetical protein C4K04_4698 [Pseudomonas chlororaphis]|uniref:Uncharacterized protein n=1 Tax=Pseudomonas chlororaphis TaxID=587753 RepID=A0A3G7TTD4_9PSED|nr:hypothetical protein [Pseudomonas chlororaphis]AZE50353.1 hypothetical protein C4K04_4698 [Pseudomonas chlororaphis]